jgi:Trk K+ transport system NAD-binding subunit
VSAAPHDAHRVSVQPGSVADGIRLAELQGLAEGTWISAIVREGALVPVRAETVLQEDDDVLILIDPEQREADVMSLFSGPARP